MEWKGKARGRRKKYAHYRLYSRRIILILFIAATLRDAEKGEKSAMAIKELPVNPDTAAELAVPPPPTNEQRLPSHRLA
ncbi:hypothetical protein D3H35_28085 [Cohnella faecalis]|uniref:Uncharacterized protein n=1 Tax=Cohnella faecalis TaxID=2315694 RepID=A0A398CDJ9_9BACL|nr:hypothetical protein D3H35_28085 [Cohnella faecalis]